VKKILDENRIFLQENNDIDIDIDIASNNV
jgi:hypothetical protein